MSALVPPKPKVTHYPDDDGLPMSDNTVQFRWIVLLETNLEAQYRDAADVFVAGNHLIYPVEDDADTRQAPDVYVAFGRPKGDRGSYKVWEEGGVFPQVVFEVWSPSNRFEQMLDKQAFYEKYGADEYYIVYPEFPAHVGVWRREGGKLVRVEDFASWVSPRLGIRFEIVRGELRVRGADGQPFRTAVEVIAERDAADRAAARAAEKAKESQAKAERLAARLRELGVDPDAV